MIENLLPKTYAIQVKKDGYQAWTKDLPVREKQVTEIKRIVLFPQSLALNVAEKNVTSFEPSPDGKKLALLEPGTQGWELSLFDIGQNLKSRLIGESSLSKTGAPIQKLEWSSDSLSIDIATTIAKQPAYYTINIQDPSQNPTPTLTPSSGAPSGALAFTTSGLSSYYIDPTGTVFKKDPLQTAPDKLSDIALPTGKDLSYKLWVYDQFVFAAVGADLYELGPQATQFTKIFQDLSSDVIPSPDNRKVAYSSASEIWVAYIKEKTDQPQKNTGDKSFIARLSKKVSGLSWFDSDYLIFQTGDAIKTAEIDDRGSINIASLIDVPATASATSTPQTSFKWDSNTKNLFIFDGSTLYQTQISTD